MSRLDWRRTAHPRRARVSVANEIEWRDNDAAARWLDSRLWSAINPDSKRIWLQPGRERNIIVAGVVYDGGKVGWIRARLRMDQVTLEGPFDDAGGNPKKFRPAAVNVWHAVEQHIQRHAHKRAS